MRKMYRGLLATGVMVVALMLNPAAAQAGSGHPWCTSADLKGCLWAWDGAYAYNYSVSCAWFNSDSNWSDDCVFEETPGGMRNRASSLVNESTHGNYARLYYHTGYTGAWACIGPGEYWDNLYNWWFNHGSGLGGYQTRIDNEIAGFKWSTSCG
ncbi:hypothetical protein [Catellatospora methionotrophica]|uniref:hypothetical protein n=1 Tax=Catellatospora methionotrophica TaxID=121620 RepID=UPI0033DDCA19